MNVIWSPEAVQDLISLKSYIAEESQSGAQRIALRILYSVEHVLPNSPHIGRPGRVPGTRELVVSQTPYIVPYRVDGENLHILRVYHGARRWPESF